MASGGQAIPFSIFDFRILIAGGAGGYEGWFGRVEAAVLVRLPNAEFGFG